MDAGNTKNIKLLEITAKGKGGACWLTSSAEQTENTSSFSFDTATGRRSAVGLKWPVAERHWSVTEKIFEAS